MRTFRVTVGGNEYEVSIEEISAASQTAARPVAAPTPVKPAASPVARVQQPSPVQPPAGEGTITAPMPGTITDVRVSQGDTVKRGDTLMILEAMKMENELKAPFDGVVSAIEVTKGAAVNAGTLLLILA